MRYDMDRVVIERPRSGSRYDYHDVRARHKGLDIEKLEDLPKHEGYRRAHRLDRKEFSDLLGPLEGYLRSHVGDKWDDVYSDIRSHLNPNSTTQIHIMGHVFQFIEVKTSLGEDGKIYTHNVGRWWKSGSPRLVSWGDLYVHPISGLICAMPERRRYYNSENAIARRKLRYVFGNEWNKIFVDNGNPFSYPNLVAESKKHIRVGYEKEFHKIDGIWYWAIFSDVPLPFTQPWFDATSREMKIRTVVHTVSDYWTKVTHTEGRYRSGKRQANRRDLRRHGLHND